MRLLGILILLSTSLLAQLDDALRRRIERSPGRSSSYKALLEADAGPAVAFWRSLPESVKRNRRYWYIGVDLAYKIHDYGMGVQAYRALAKDSIEAGNYAQASRVESRLYVFHAKFGATRAARAALERAIAYARKAKVSSSKLEGELQAFGKERRTRNIPTVNELRRRLDRSLATLRTNPDRDLARIHNELTFVGRTAWHWRAWSLGYEAFRAAIRIHGRLKNPSPNIIGDALNGGARMAVEAALRTSGDRRRTLYADALEWGLSALDFHRRARSGPDLILGDHCVLADAYEGTGQAPLAEKHYQEEMGLIEEMRRNVEGVDGMSLRVFHGERHHVYDNYAIFLSRHGNGGRDALLRALKISETGRIGALRQVLRFKAREGLDWMKKDLVFDTLQQRAAAADAAVLVYLLGEYRAGIIAVTAEGPTWHPLPPVDQLDAIADRFGETVMDAAASRRAIRRHGKAAFDALIAPARSAWRDRSRIVLVGAGRFSHVPFGALVTDVEAPLEKSYLAVRHAAVHAPTLTALLVTPERRDHERAFILGHGGRPEPPYDPELAHHYSIDDLAPLDRAAEEALSAAATLGAEAAAIDATATESAWRKGAPDADLIHVAAHAIVSDRDAARSALLLNPDERDDGFLTLTEILDTPLRARLVVFSACRTAVGRRLAGEGARGLGRALLLTGADTVLVSRAPVNDQFAPAFLAPFHAAVATGTPLPDALAAAQRKMLERRLTAHPSLWAPFMMIGQGALTELRR